MNLANLVKINGIKLADAISLRLDPFSEFTRPIVPAPGFKSYEESEKFFYDQIQSDFLLPNGVFTICKVYPGEALSVGDQALWHGMYVAMLAKKFKVTSSPDVKTALIAAVAAMKVFFVKNLLVRGVNPVDGSFQDDCSNDTLTGVTAAIYFANDAGADVSEINYDLMRELIDHKFSLVNQDGTPTTYGKLENGALTDPLRVSLLLATLLTAQKVGCVSGIDAYRDLRSKYQALLPYAYARLHTLYKDYDMHRAALHLYILKQLDPTLRDLCTQGLERIWQYAKKSQNPWVGALCGRPCVERLKEFDPIGRGLEVENTVPSNILTLQWKGETCAEQALPFWMMAQQDFFPQRNLFATKGWVGYTDRRLRYSGLDYLLAYWFSK